MPAAIAIAEIPKPAPTPAPAPAPAPTPAPAPVPDPSAAPGATSDQAFDDKFSHLDDAPEIPVKPAPVAKPATSPATKPEPAAAKPEPAKPAESFEPPAAAKPADLRGWALTQGKKAKAATEENTRLQNRIKELESKPTPQDNGQSKVMAEQLASAQKRIEEYENELRVTRYEKHPEYKEKYERPYVEGLKRAYRDVGQLTVIERQANPEDPDHPIEKERTATNTDFDVIYNQQSLGSAMKMAKQMFGDSAQVVLQHRQKLLDISESAQQAIEEYRTKGSEREKQESIRAKQEQEFAISAFQKANASMRQKSPEFFDERPDDPEGNKLLSDGMNFADIAFDPDEISKYPLPQQVAIHARARTWAGAFPRLRHDLLTLKAQLAEANATIEQLRGSDPGKPTPSGEEVPVGNQTLDDAFEAKFGR